MINLATGRRAEIVDHGTTLNPCWSVHTTNGRLSMGTETFDDLEEARDAARDFINGRLTNTEIIVNMMERSTAGPLIQAFVMQAIEQFSLQVQDADLPEGGFVSPAAWKACAKDALLRLRAEHAYQGDPS